MMGGLLAGCQDDDFLTDGMGPDGEVLFRIEIDTPDGTRTAVDESKTRFQEGELVHIRAEFDCEKNGEQYKRYHYGVLQYAGKGIWSPYGDAYALKWPDEAKTGTFTAYYIYGSNGVLTSNNVDPKLISDYAFDEIPLHGQAVNVRYGEAVKLPMKRVFALLTLTEMKEGISDELWFTIPETEIPADDEAYTPVPGEEPRELPYLNNAFRIVFDPDNNYEMRQEFSRIPSVDYRDSNGKNLAFVKSRFTRTVDPDNPENVSTEINFLLEPGAYHQFTLLYPRGRTTYATYLTYGHDLSRYTSTKGFVANGRYTFSILKSLGVIVEETPEEGWDESEPVIIVDVDAFMKSVNSGNEYYEKDLNSDEDVQITEKTDNGLKLLRNIDFRYYQYDVLKDGTFPNLNLTFNGDYHYIYHLGCPLFYENNGTIINLGLKEAETKTPIISSEHLPRNGTTIDNSYNGFIASRNYGTVSNMRVAKASMRIQIQTTNPDEPAHEAHNASLLFGSNIGNVYDIGISDELTLTVENAAGEEIMPGVQIGSVAAQNLGSVTGITPIEEEGYVAPTVRIYNRCAGDNGVYRVGGVVGNNMGALYDIFMPSVTVDASASNALESYLGGLAGDIPSSSSSTPVISGCIVRGEVTAGALKPLLNLDAYSYTGGVAGSMHIQCSISDSSISVGVTDNSPLAEDAQYAAGGAFGQIKSSVGYREGGIQTLACFGSTLKGHGYLGNFAGMAPSGYGWSHYQNNEINVRRLVENNVGLEY